MLEYRDVKFEYKEWRTWNNQLACGYTCEDQKILEGIDTVSFGARSLDEMHGKIDSYIDNRSSNLELKEMSDKAIQEFYNTNHYKGD
tara:strand:+ start:391 stop:651 length:261 start_codon:yes stop_codon:yes gene_type:complete